jgi:hypothetical protein
MEARALEKERKQPKMFSYKRRMDDGLDGTFNN